MAATLIVEDGSGVPGSNSYIDIAFARQYADNRGVTLPETDADLIPMLINAADYIESFSEDFKGSRKSPDQSMSWPRTNVVIDNVRFPDDEIPTQLRMAQAQGVVEIVNGEDLQPPITGYAVRREKVDVIEVEYATGGGSAGNATSQFTPKFPKILQWLRPLLKNAAGLLKVYRV